MVSDVSSDVRMTEMVGTLYEAVTDRTAWARAAEQFAALVGGHQCIMLLALSSDPEPASVVTFGIEAATRSLYLDMLDEDVWLDGMLRLPSQSPCLSEQFITLRDLRKTAFYNDLCAPADVAHMAGAVICRSADRTTLIATQRSAAGGPFGERELRRIRLLMPHFHQAVFLNQTLGEFEHAMLSVRSVLNGLSLVAILTDGHGRLCWCNVAAQRYLRSPRGVGVSRDGRLTAATPDETRALRHLIRQAGLGTCGKALAAGGELRIRTSAAGMPCRVTVCPLDRMDGAWGHRAVAVTFIADPNDPPEMSFTALGDFYALTPAELRLCRALVSGLSLNEAADAGGISVHTVRSQLKSVFRKCGVNSQSQLLLRLVQTSGGWTGSR